MRVGRRSSPVLLDRVRSVLSYLELGYRIEHDPSSSTPQAVKDYRALFELALTRVTGERPVYLEFGVYKGRSMRWWSSHLTQAGATLVGFDSFEGLPEDWRPDYDAGAFATGGPPSIDDERVSFVVGWFEDTIAGFEMPDHDQLIVNIDCDLYSST